MSATPKKKLCWNCDGNVPLQAEHCPYCGVYIEQTAGADEEEEIVEEIHTPPYGVKASRGPNGTAPEPPFPSNSDGKSYPKQPTSSTASKSTTQKHKPLQSHQVHQIALPLLLLMCGSIFALFGLVLILFSENGIFVLKWNGDHWPYYLVAGILLLIGGWRFLSRIDDNEP